MKTLIVLSGIPGCGKSTWTNNYQNSHPNTYIVESDEIRKRLTGGYQIFNQEANVWKTYMDELVEYSNRNEDLTVIADSTNLQNIYRKNYCVNTPNYDRHVLVFFDIPFDVAEKNNRKRKLNKIVPDYAMKKLEAELEPISDEIRTLYDEVIVINSYTLKK